ncbi:uncharacterized protein EDB91DRAFT_1083143 [Suillus paluster]|uniref:uncharacterized protein n=1 Tax=Suillus paluster TaxID=48578 RepID=UPI001B87721D|nr:uncharacterized protein EDB91DRAFT_1083143 [Suillus paluster]KAG1737104.1 hypothetical protein EDB91DRAFT_1083143 [Suillus paluster]
MFISSSITMKQEAHDPCSHSNGTPRVLLVVSKCPGLVCCGIVSAWTWSATLLQSSTAAYIHLVSAALGQWYGAGGSIQVAMFGMVAAKVKMNANGAHMFLEIVKVCFGTTAHIVFTIYASLFCVLAGGAASVNALTGMNLLAAYFLLQLALRLSEVSTCIESAQIKRDIIGDRQRSFQDLRDIGKGLNHVSVNLKAIMLGGLSWFAVPWAFGSCLDLSALFSSSANTNTMSPPLFPTYPFPLSPEQTSAGIAAPAAAAVLMGKGGAMALLLVVFMAVTSAAGAEFIAVSSVVIYRTYWNPQATGAKILHTVNVDLGWVRTFPDIIPSGLNRVASVVLRSAHASRAFTMWFHYGSNSRDAGMDDRMLEDQWRHHHHEPRIANIGQPDNYDFEGTRAIAMLNSSENNDPDSDVVSGEKREKSNFEVGPTDVTQEDPLCRETLQRVFRRAAWYSNQQCPRLSFLSGGYTACVVMGESHRPSSPVIRVFLALRVQRAVLHILGGMLYCVGFHERDVQRYSSLAGAVEGDGSDLEETWTARDYKIVIVDPHFTSRLNGGRHILRIIPKMLIGPEHRRRGCNIAMSIRLNDSKFDFGGLSTFQQFAGIGCRSSCNIKNMMFFGFTSGARCAYGVPVRDLCNDEFGLQSLAIVDVLMILEYFWFVSDEFRLVWPRVRKSIEAKLFLVTRMQSGVSNDAKDCRSWYSYQTAMIQWLLLAVEVILMRQVYKIFQKDKYITGLLFVFAGAQIAAMAWRYFRGTSRLSEVSRDWLKITVRDGSCTTIAVIDEWKHCFLVGRIVINQEKFRESQKSQKSDGNDPHGWTTLLEVEPEGIAPFDDPDAYPESPSDLKVESTTHVSTSFDSESDVGTTDITDERPCEMAEDDMSPSGCSLTFTHTETGISGEGSGSRN